MNNRKRCVNERNSPDKRIKFTPQNHDDLQEEMIYQHECFDYLHDPQIKQLWIQIRQAILELHDFQHYPEEHKRLLQLTEDDYQEMGFTHQLYIDHLIKQLPEPLQYSHYLYM